MESTIFAQIRKEADDFFNLSISPVPGYSFNQYDTIKQNILYQNSKFVDNSPYAGRQKLFFNVVNPPREVATKQLNIDSKNVRLYPMSPKSYFSTYLLEKELREWLKKNEFSEILNSLAEEAPAMGSVVLEKTPKGVKIVDLRRLMNDPSVETIDQSRFVTTVHYMTTAELQKTGWDNVDVAIERFGNSSTTPSFEDDNGDLNQQSSSPYVKVYKRYGEVPEKWLDGGTSEKLVRSVFIVSGADDQVLNTEGKPIGEAGVILFKSRWKKEWPFRDFHYTKIKGRWLGVGVIEMLWDVQERFNELKNQKRIALEIGAGQTFQTTDKQIVRNILTDLEPGALLYSKSRIEPIATEERNLTSYKMEEDSYHQQVERLTFAYEAVRGETPASSTPLGTTQIVTAQAMSVYGFKRQNFTIFLREFFNELVLPQLLKDLSAEHVMRFTGNAQELAKLDQAAAELYANDLAKEVFLGGGVISREALEVKKQLYIQEFKKLGSQRFLKIKDAFYDNVDMEFDFVFDDENVDLQTLTSNLQRVIGDLAGNPAILQDERLKLLYYKFAEKLGISPAELEMADQAQQNKESAQPPVQLPAPQQKPVPSPYQPNMQGQ